MKRTLLFSLMAVLLAGFGFGGVSLADPDPVEQVTVTYYYEGNEYQTVQVDKGTKRSALTLKTIDDTQFCGFYTTEDGTSTFSFGSTAINEDLNIYGRKCSVTILDEEDNVIKEKYYVDKNTILADPTNEFLATYSGKCFYFATSKTASRTTFSATAPKITAPKVYYLINKDCTYDIYMNGEKVDTKEFTRGEVVEDFTDEYKATNENLAGFYTAKTSNVLFDFTQSQLYPFAVYGREYNIEIDGVKTVGELTKANIMGKQVKLLEDKDMQGTFYRFELKNNEQVNINLNGHTLTINGAYFNIYNGAVTITGPGKIIFKAGTDIPAFGMYGQTSNNGKYANLTIGEGVEIETTRSPIWINPNGSTAGTYGVIVDIFGKITTTGENSFGLYINGTATNTEGATKIHLRNGSEISNPNGYAVYLAGYSETTIEENVKITGKQAAIEIRAGILDIDGGEFTSTTTSTFEQANGNGTTIGGAALAVSQHTTNKPINVVINGGTFNGVKALYEKDLQDEVATGDILISINSGNFNGEVSSENIIGFIEGGLFSTEPNESYIAEGKKAFLYGNKYKVATARTVTFDPNNKDATASVDVADGTTVTKPADPTNTGYIFQGWFNGEDEFDFESPVTSNLTLTAKWEAMISAGTAKIAQDDGTGTGMVVEADVPATETAASAVQSSNSTATVQGEVELNVYNDADGDGDKDGTPISTRVNFTSPVLVRIPVNSGSSAKVKVKHNGDSTFGTVGLTTSSTATCNNGVSNVPYNGGDIAVTSGYVEIYTCSASTFVAYTEVTNPTSSSSTSGGGGGGGGSSRTSALDDTKATTGNNAKLDGMKADETKLEENNDGDGAKTDPMIDVQAVEKFGQEQIDAYKWALENGITTMKTVEEARLDDPLTRAELAKMMVVYIQKVLKKDPVVTGDVNYPDVKVEEIGDLVDYVKLAYQYQIMGINADGTPIELFNPHGIVSRGEYATVFSRVLFGAKFNKKGADFYTNHLEALKTAGILTNTLPTIQEMRGWVMLMMYRSSQNGEAIEKVANSTEEIVDEAKVEETVSEETVNVSDEEKSEGGIDTEETTKDSTEESVSDESSETPVNTAEATTGDALLE